MFPIGQRAVLLVIKLAAPADRLLIFCATGHHHHPPKNPNNWQNSSFAYRHTEDTWAPWDLMSKNPAVHWMRKKWRAEKITGFQSTLLKKNISYIVTDIQGKPLEWLRCKKIGGILHLHRGQPRDITSWESSHLLQLSRPACGLTCPHAHLMIILIPGDTGIAAKFYLSHGTKHKP